jgi:DNA-binding transcriptional LysR family regulator
MDKFNDLHAFFKTAELGSFVAAGRALGLTASAVGKGVARLEAEVGVRLLQRSTRRMQLTDEGRLLQAHCERLLHELDDARAMMSRMREQPRGKLRLSAPIVLHHVLLPLLPDFLARYPEMEIDADFSDRAPDLIAEGIDLAIRSSWPEDSRLVSRPLQAFTLRLWATPGYLARHGTPGSVQDLARHAAIRFRHPDTGKLLPWPTLAGPMLAEPPARTLLAFNNIEAVLSAALRGLGIACMPDFLVAHAQVADRLQPVLADQLGAHGRYQALWPSSRHLSPKVRAFIDHLAATMQAPEVSGSSTSDSTRDGTSHGTRGGTRGSNGASSPQRPVPGALRPGQ